MDNKEILLLLLKIKKSLIENNTSEIISSCKKLNAISKTDDDIRYIKEVILDINRIKTVESAKALVSNLDCIVDKEHTLFLFELLASIDGNSDIKNNYINKFLDMDITNNADKDIINRTFSIVAKLILNKDDMELLEKAINKIQSL